MGKRDYSSKKINMKQTVGGIRTVSIKKIHSKCVIHKIKTLKIKFSNRQKTTFCWSEI